MVDKNMKPVWVEGYNRESILLATESRNLLENQKRIHLERQSNTVPLGGVDIALPVKWLENIPAPTTRMGALWMTFLLWNWIRIQHIQTEGSPSGHIFKSTWSGWNQYCCRNNCACCQYAQLVRPGTKGGLCKHCPINWTGESETRGQCMDSSSPYTKWESSRGLEAAVHAREIAVLALETMMG